MNQEKELWRDIKGYENSYQVSSFGNVRSLDRVVTASNGRKCNFKGKTLSPVHNKAGYLYVNLLKKGQLKSKTIHRLVAEAFIPNINNKPQVNHVDENKRNNHIDNLEWVTIKENANHGSRNYKISESRKQKVFALEVSTGKKIVFETLTEAKRYFSIKGNNMVYDKLFTRGKMKGFKIVKCEENIV